MLRIDESRRLVARDVSRTSPIGALSVLGALALFGATPATADPSRVVERPVWKSGECVWLRYSHSGAIAKRCIIESNSDRIQVEHGMNKQVTNYTADFNVIDFFRDRSYFVIGTPVIGYRVVYKPSTCHFNWPLYAGKQWRCEPFYFINGFGYQATFEVQVGEPEMLEFQWTAGPMEGQRETLEVWPMQQVYKQRWDVTKMTCWYAPKLKSRVKCESTVAENSYEMVGHNRGGDEQPESGQTSPSRASEMDR